MKSISKADHGCFLTQWLSAGYGTWVAMPEANNQTFPQVSRCKIEKKERVMTTAAVLACLWQMILSRFLLISNVMTFPFKNTAVDRLGQKQGSKGTATFALPLICWDSPRALSALTKSGLGAGDETFFKKIFLHRKQVLQLEKTLICI